MVIESFQELEKIAKTPCSCVRQTVDPGLLAERPGDDPPPLCVSCQAKEILDDLGQLGESMIELYKEEEPKESKNPNCKCDCHDSYDFWRTCCTGEGRQQRRKGR